MGRTYEILKTTDSISRAIENQSLDHAREVLTVLRDDMREYEVDDKAYPELLEKLDTLLDSLESHEERSSEELPEELIDSLDPLLERIDSLYLRKSEKGEIGGSPEESAEEIRLERALYQTKSVQLANTVERYHSALSKQLENQQNDYDTVAEVLSNWAAEIESSNPSIEPQITDRLQELDQVENELEKMKERREQFREKHDLDT
jgi:DNA repair exonuclease SbcCD ATPase subunit